MLESRDQGASPTGETMWKRYRQLLSRLESICSYRTMETGGHITALGGKISVKPN